MSAPRRVVLSLISHTNVGKTTLARTLLRRDVGEVLDQAHVTDATERFVLFEGPGGEQVVLSDNPGFGDSVRLLRRLRGLPDPLAWLVGQVWDRFAERPLFCSQQAIRHVREEADLVLYLVNASEDPVSAGYVAPELELLAWIGRPVVLLLNQTGVPGDRAAQERDSARWRELAAAHPVVRDVLPLDAFTRCWVQEGLLYARLAELAPEDAPGPAARAARAAGAASSSPRCAPPRGRSRSCSPRRPATPSLSRAARAASCGAPPMRSPGASPRRSPRRTSA